MTEASSDITLQVKITDSCHP